MSEHYDALETRSADQRAAWLREALPRQVAHAKGNAPWFGESLKEVDAAAVSDRAAIPSVASTPWAC